MLFFGGTLAYPLLYGWIYNNETLYDMPVAVIDNSHSAQSRDYIRHLDATPEVAITHHCISMAEAQILFTNRQVHGIVLVPATFADDLARGRQTIVSIYADMGSFIYYRGLVTAATFMGMDYGDKVQVKRLTAAGLPSKQAMAAANPIASSYTPMFNAGSGYGNFLIPAVLVLVIHQTLLLGICMLAGINREKNKFRLLVPMSKRYFGTIRIVGGKMLAYFSIYILLIFFVLLLVPRWFGLPHSGNILDIYLLFVPFLFAVIFFAMTVSAIFHSREAPILMLLFLSIPLVFISGVVWPLDNMPAFWRGLAYLLPSTHGVQGFIKINSMGANFSQVRTEYLALCLQIIGYGTTTCLLYKYQIIKTQRAIGRH
ncbi:membrane protein [Bacteroidia bacterium]|nr:membrane protein [Bacteroidia bacterium]